MGGGAAAAGVWKRQGRSFRRYVRQSHALGSKVHLTIWHDHAAIAHEALEAAFDGIDAVEEVMSLYRPHSQLCRLNKRGHMMGPHPDLVRVFTYAQKLSRLSNGAFDITVQPLWQARTLGKDLTELDRVDWRQVELSSSRIAFKRPGMQATLNGIAQGFAADRVSEILSRFGVQHALIDTGEHHALGHRDGEAFWRTGIQHPRDPDAFLAVAGLANRCLATSGDYATTLTNDFSEHHLIDPNTGRSPKELSSVSVAAATSMEADALSTAAFVLGLERGMALIEKTPGADALMVRKADGRRFASNGFPIIEAV